MQSRTEALLRNKEKGIAGGKSCPKHSRPADKAESEVKEGIFLERFHPCTSRPRFSLMLQNRMDQQNTHESFIKQICDQAEKSFDKVHVLEV